MIDKATIKTLATRFRHAIDEAKINKEFLNITPFNRFPSGCCGDSCDLLAQFLLENNIETYYVCGTFCHDENSYDSISHAWLKTGKIIIDITGDQFKNSLHYDKDVYVGLIDDFHKSFEFDERKDVTKSKRIEEYDNPARDRLSRLYNIILCYF